MLKIVIVEDDTATRDLLKNMISQSLSDIEIIGETDSVTGGIKSIQENNPDVVLLDINLSDGNGFEILEKTQSNDYMVIFITAYNNYAIKAFRISAIDYLLKPVDINDLIDALKKCKKQKEIGELNIKLDALFSNLKSEVNQDKKIVLKSSDTIHVVPIHEIIRCESVSNYTTFYLKNNRKLLISKTLKEFDDLLREYDFFRSHQSHLVNMNYVESYEKPHGGLLVMSDKSRVPVAFRKREALLNLFNHL
ncbi:MAG: LytTR family DNA-binding domain-containing protein [Melioribacteraceae bacterium]|nr:LytTR family DNA-binding domain-containing protein [Melioribacteraceae bacterium]